MLEKDIENLVALYPEEFFPNESLKLVGQQVKLGRCYADIVFTDKHSRTIIVEVKRGILTRDAAGQILEYYGLLKQQNHDQIIELILCANTIPSERRVFLERAGIDCKELDTSLISNVAKKYNYKFTDEPKEENIIKVSQEEVQQTQVAKKESSFREIEKAEPKLTFNSIKNDFINFVRENVKIQMNENITENRVSFKNGALNFITLMPNAQVNMNLCQGDNTCCKFTKNTHFNNHGTMITSVRLNNMNDYNVLKIELVKYFNKHVNVIKSAKK
jgi:hypothetical protein